MKRFMWAALLGSMMIGLCGLTNVVNAETAAPDLGRYLADLQVKLDHAARRVNQPSSAGSSVIGLRGSKQESTSKQLYWKGVQNETPVSPAEVKQFRSAVEMARNGQKKEAVTELEAFQKTYPKSAMLPDVQETIRRLNAPAPVVASTPS